MPQFESTQLSYGNGFAGANLSSYQYYPVAMDSTGGGFVVVADGSKMFGILADAPTANDACKVVFSGIAMARLGSACATKGEALMTGSGGLVPYSAGGSNVISAYLLNVTGTTADIVPVMVV